MHTLQPTTHALDHVLPYFRAVMPGAHGVVLSTAHGQALAHDMDEAVDGIAAAAVRLHADACGCAPLTDAAHGASVLVPHRGGVVLVVFVPGQPALPSAPVPVAQPAAIIAATAA